MSTDKTPAANKWFNFVELASSVGVMRGVCILAEGFAGILKFCRPFELLRSPARQWASAEQVYLSRNSGG